MARPHAGAKNNKELRPVCCGLHIDASTHSEEFVLLKCGSDPEILVCPFSNFLYFVYLSEMFWDVMCDVNLRQS